MGVLQREKDTAAAARFERRWLFHGTDQDTVPKITQQGFNRSFCGKNATAYGKGVYFALNSSYSACDQYSPPRPARASTTSSYQTYGRATFSSTARPTTSRTRTCTSHIMTPRHTLRT